MHKQQILEQINGNKQLKEFLESLTLKTKDLYKTTQNSTYEMFPRPEAKDALPTIRRAAFETEMYKVANDLEVEQASVLNAARNSSHREIKIDQFLLTSNHVNAPNVLVRDSNFRKTLAANSQMSFFDGEREKQDKESGHVYGTILHGEFLNKEDISTPFIYLAFPNQELTDYVLRINLLDLFKHKSVVNTDIEVVYVEDTVEPVFKEAGLAKEN